jgi:hypothetical protein
MAVGVLFLISAEYKIFGAEFTRGGDFEFWINRFLAESTYPFMAPILKDFAASCPDLVPRLSQIIRGLRDRQNVPEGTALFVGLPLACPLVPGHRRIASVNCNSERTTNSVYTYCSSPWPCSSLPCSLLTPETVPVNSPVAAKKTGLLEASANTGDTVSVKDRTPDAFLKRPVPPVI